MFHPAVIDRREAKLLSDPRFKAIFPSGLPRVPIDVAQQRAAELETLLDSDGKLTRRLTPEETRYITSERLASKIDFRYWLERYTKIRKATTTGLQLRPLSPLWESQELVLRKLAERELAIRATNYPDGILATVLKARQLGVTTLTEAIITHRVTTRTYQSALLAADVTEQSGYMFNDIFLQMIEHLPWFLKPTVRSIRTAGEKRHVQWENHSIVRMSSGKSMRGALQGESSRKKGNIGRGRTHGLVHLTELPTWENPAQIDNSLEPGIPAMQDAFALFEATASGRDDWWHEHWRISEAETYRYFGIFIGWYIEKRKYWLPAPVSWQPSSETLAHAGRIELTSSRWVGSTVTPTREQLYWYERRRSAMAKAGRLGEFLGEFPAEPEEAFQHAGRSIFTVEQVERLKGLAKPPVGGAYEFVLSGVPQ